MDIIAQIELMPSFYAPHSWTMAITDDFAMVEATCADSTSKWELDSNEINAIPDEIRTGYFPDKPYSEFGIDGITVQFQIETNGVARTQKIWCPNHSQCGGYAVLLKWCWDGLYCHSRLAHRIYLEQLRSYFHDWGVNGFTTKQGLRLFGKFSSGDEKQLSKLFDAAARILDPVVDMTNFEGTGTLLYPTFLSFFQRVPNSRWYVNDVAYRYMIAAGIPETAMELVTSNLL